MSVAIRGPERNAPLATKLYPPRARPGLVARPRLLAQLDAGLAGALILLAAPAGSGKTTLLADWLRTGDTPSHARKVAWLSLDAGDNDPVRFLRYLSAAIQTVAAEVGEAALALLRSPGPPPTEPLLIDLINGLAALEQEVVLVLDDYHVLRAPPLHEAVTFLLEHRPASLHLVIATRADPPLPLARLRAQRLLTELRAADLRFSPDETATFLRQVMGLDLALAEVAALGERTEGWIAGLQLAALSLRDQADAATFVAAFAGSNRHIVDYLVDEVLARQPAHVRDLLLRTAVLERLCGPLCDALLSVGWPISGDEGRTLEAPAPVDGQALLEELERANLFLVPLDAERTWYRFHHLFGDVLRQRLRREFGEGAVAALHARASAWFERAGLVDEAVDHALAAGDFERAADLVEQAGQRAFDEGRNTTAQRWLEALPPAVVRARPRLSLLYAWVLSALGRGDELEQHVQDALAGGAVTPAAVVGEAAAVRAGFAAYHGHAARAVDLARAAVEALPDDHHLRGVATLILGDAHLVRGDASAAAEALSVAAFGGLPATHPYVPLLAACFLGEVRILQGRLREAEHIYRDVLRQCVAPPLRLYWIGCYAHAGLGALQYEWNDLHAAAEHLEHGFELARYGTTERARISLYLTAARLKAVHADWAGAAATLVEAEQFAHQVSLGPAVAPVPAARARLQLARGEIAAAARWAAECGLRVADPEVGLPRPYPRDVEYLTLARLCIAQGQPAAALPLLERLLHAATGAGRMGRVIEIHLLRALALAAHNEPAAALTALEAALALAEPAGYVRLFWDEGPAVLTLLRQAASRGVAPAYVAELLREALEAEASGPPAKAAIEPLRAGRRGSSTTLIEPLSDRELEVLRLLATGAPNQEIATRLVVAVATVKTHVRNLLAKLDATNRTQAVARARDLGLL